VDRPSIVRTETHSNGELNDTDALPMYTLSAAEDESTLDAEQYRPEKSPARDQSHTAEASLDQKPSQSPAHDQIQAGPSHSDDAPPEFTDLPPDYFTELTNNAAAVHTKRCSILKERPATWLIKGKSMALCPLAATVLTKEGLIKSKHLELLALPPSSVSTDLTMIAFRGHQKPNVIPPTLYPP
jgi:hypothetical protein